VEVKNSLFHSTYVYQPLQSASTDRDVGAYCPEKDDAEITLVLASSRRIRARHKDLVKVTVKFIRRGAGGEKRERSISCSPCRKWGQRLKMVVPNSDFILESWGEYTGQR
jgi:hypothetical protein